MTVDNYFDTPFAQNGDKTAIPDALDPAGYVSYDQGYTSDYALPSTDPSYKTIERDKFNDLMFQVTTALQQYQQHGTPPFITSAMNGGTPYSYSKYDRVILTGVVYTSLVNANTDTPPSAKWTDKATVPDGGTGVASFTAYAPIIGGTTSTGALQSVALGTAGFVYTSNGAGAAPTFQNVVNLLYPVGSIYWNKTDSTNPGTLFGVGTWVALTDVFIAAKGSTFTTTGGALTQTLSSGNLPAHDHFQYANEITTTVTASGLYINSSQQPAATNYNGSGGSANYATVGTSTGATVGKTSSVGSSTAFSIVPPYDSAYCWYRTV